jgi:hypothetical protein
MTQQTEDDGEEGQGGGNTKQKRAKRNHLIKAQMMRLPVRARGLNRTMKYQFLMGRD